MKNQRQKAHCEECENALRRLQALVEETEGIERARVLILLGEAATINLQDELAIASFGAALDLLPSGQFPELESAGLFKESCVLAAQDRFDEAIPLAETAKSICEGQGDSPHLSLIEWRLGLYYAEVGRIDEAIALVTSALNRYRTLDGFEEYVECVEVDLQRLFGIHLQAGPPPKNGKARRGKRSRWRGNRGRAR